MPRERPAPYIYVASRNRSLSPRAPCAEPVTRVAAAGNKTRVTITSARDARPARDRDQPYAAISYDRQRVNRSNYYDRDYGYHRDRSRDEVIRRRRSRERRYSEDSGGLRDRLRRSRSKSPRRTTLEEVIVIPGDENQESRRRDEQVGDPSRSRSRSRSRLRYSRSERYERNQAEDLVVGLEDDISVLDFDLSLSASDDKLEGESASETTAMSSYNGHVPVGLSTESSILYTRWLGNTFDDWALGAELFIPSSPPTKASKPAMRWVHIQRDLMNFDEFLAITRASLHLPTEDKRHAIEVLRKAQKEHEKQRQHGREMEAFCVGDVDYQDTGDDRSQTSSICFLSFPCFALEKHSENHLRTLSVGSPEHPSRPLVQSYTRTVNERRELAQAITTLATTPKGSCLHVANIWTLVVNENLLITCSKASLKSLRHDAITTSSDIDSSPHVTIRAGSTRSWRIPRKHALAWPSMVSYFTDRVSDITGFEAGAAFKMRGRTIDSSTWTDMSDGLSHSNVELNLLTQYGSNGKVNKAKTLREARERFVPSLRQDASNKTTTRDEDGDDDASVTSPFKINAHFLEAEKIGNLKILLHSSGGSEESMSTLTNTLSKALEQSEQLRLRESYASCGESSRGEIQEWLVAFASVTATQERQSKSKRRQRLDVQKEWIVILSEYVFGFFYPLDFNHVLTRKFWGALRNVLDGDTFYGHADNDPHYDLSMADDFLEQLYDDLVSFVASFSKAFNGQENQLKTLPNQFLKAWLHIVAAFLIASETKFKSTHPQQWRLPIEQLRYAVSQLKEGERLLTAKLRSGIDIETYEVCSSRGIVALVLDRLSKDLIHSAPDVSQVYGDYYQQLEAKIMTDSLNRSHQETIRALHQELDAVSSTLTAQLEVINVFDENVRQLESGQELPDLPPLRDSRQDSVIRQTKATINSRLDQFKALEGRATDLGDWHLSAIDTNKDRQEAAIMVFTIVTIIFLPLSFVASVLGMNTADIRDMSQQQWIYWATAVPLTILVAGGSLWWAGVFGDLGNWLAKPSGSSQTQYYTPREDAPVVQIESMERRAPISRVQQPVYSVPRRRTTYPVKQRYNDGY